LRLARANSENRTLEKLQKHHTGVLLELLSKEEAPPQGERRGWGPVIVYKRLMLDYTFRD
jgi:hypothetical protein